MGAIKVSAPVKEMALSAIVIRADGTTENLGEIAYWHQNRAKRLLRRVTTLMKKLGKE